MYNSYSNQVIINRLKGFSLKKEKNTKKTPTKNYVTQSIFTIMVFNSTIRQQLTILGNCALEKQKLIV